eukprot:6192883-Pleurochrysis_carterae.AAC.1
MRSRRLFSRSILHSTALPSLRSWPVHYEGSFALASTAFSRGSCDGMGMLWQLGVKSGIHNRGARLHKSGRTVSASAIARGDERWTRQAAEQKHTGRSSRRNDGFADALVVGALYWSLRDASSSTERRAKGCGQRTDQLRMPRRAASAGVGARGETHIIALRYGSGGVGMAFAGGRVQSRRVRHARGPSGKGEIVAVTRSSWRAHCEHARASKETRIEQRPAFAHQWARRPFSASCVRNRRGTT